MWKRRAKQPETQLSLLRDIKRAVLVIMYCSAIIAGSTCDLAEIVTVTVELIEEPDEAEADRAMAIGVRL